VSNKRLTVWIHGREVLPVRALPYVTETQRFSPDSLAKRFAQCDAFGKKWALEAYSVLGADGFTVSRWEWDEVVARVDSFEIELKKMGFTPITAYALWRTGAAAALPASWFVYLDEFEKAVEADLEDIIFVGGPPNSDKLTLSPVIDMSTRAMVMEGFERFPEHNPAASLSLNQVQSIAQAGIEASPPVQKTGALRINENRAFLLECEREGIRMHIEAIWLHIRRNSGKDNFLFKTVSKETATTVEGNSLTKKNLARVLADLLKARKSEKLA
jgi:hypothetical protein